MSDHDLSEVERQLLDLAADYGRRKARAAEEGASEFVVITRRNFDMVCRVRQSLRDGGLYSSDHHRLRAMASFRGEEFDGAPLEDMHRVTKPIKVETTKGVDPEQATPVERPAFCIPHICYFRGDWTRAGNQRMVSCTVQNCKTKQTQKACPACKTTGHLQEPGCNPCTACDRTGWVPA